MFPRKPGRPRALDETKRREITALLTAGYSIEDASRYVGCAPSTIRREASRNPGFSEAIRRAGVNAQIDALKAVREAAKRDWRAGAWLLERLNPQRFAKQNLRALKPEQFDALLEIVVEFVAKEVKDPEAFGRIGKRLEKLSATAAREAQAVNEPTFKAPPLPRPRNRPPRTLEPDDS